MLRRALPAILLLALGARLLCWRRMLVMMNDGPDHLWQAARLLEGDLAAALSHPYHPLYAAATALASFLTPDLASAAVAVSVASGLVLVWAIWDLTRHVFPERPCVAAAAALLAAVHTRTVENGADVGSDGLFVALVALAGRTLAGALAAGGRARLMAGAGLLAGLAFLTRPEGLFLCAVVAVWMIARWRAGMPWGPTLRAAAAFAAGLLALLAPYAAFIHAQTGILGLSTKPALSLVQPGALSNATLPEGAPLSWPRVPRLRRAPPAPVAEPAQPAPAPVREGSLVSWPLAGIRLVGTDYRNAPLVSTLIKLGSALRGEAVLLALVGLGVLARRRRDLALWTCGLLALWVVLLSAHAASAHYLSNRHMLLPLALLLPACGAGWVALFTLRTGLGPIGDGACRWAGRALAVLCLLTLTATATNPRRADEDARLKALAWLGQNTTPGETFGADRRRDAFYVDPSLQRPALVVALPCDEALLLRRLREHRVRYLALDERLLRAHAPAWLEPSAPFTLAGRFEGHDPDDTVLVLRHEPR